MKIKLIASFMAVTILLSLFAAASVSAQNPSAVPAVSSPYTVTVGTDKTFTSFNYHSASFENDPNNILPWPDSRCATSTGNAAYVSLSATQGHAGEALADVGVNYTLDLGPYTWAQVQNWPITVTFDFSYATSASYVPETGSSNAWLWLGHDFLQNPTWGFFGVGYEAGAPGSQSGSSIMSFNETLGGQPLTVAALANPIIVEAFCQAHNANGTVPNTSSATITVNSITIKFAALTPTTLTISAPTSALVTQPFPITGTLTDTNGNQLAGQTVSLQRLSGTTWTTIASQSTTAAGAYSFSRIETSAKIYQYRTTYAGSSIYANSTSPTATVQVAKIPTPKSTQLSLSVTNPTPAINQKVTLIATLMSGKTPLSGENVTIYHYLGSIRYNDTTYATNATGQINFTMSFASTGTHTYYATFGGDMLYKASTSAPVTIRVH